MMNCRESERLLSERRDHALPWKKHLALRLHLFLCVLCRGYDAQLSAVLGVCHRAGAEASSHAPSLSAEQRRAIQDAMERERR
ncbi:MAG TPA: hypothetical protein VFH88_07930 [Candidatus Krumholzibacteria bacterium]|nr:hypothetical protein [Candidatus Krumholzibacteria bacterium]